MEKKKSIYFRLVAISVALSVVVSVCVSLYFFCVFCAFCTSCALPWVFRVLLCVFSAFSLRFLCVSLYFFCVFSVLSVRSHGFSVCLLTV